MDPRLVHMFNADGRRYAMPPPRRRFRWSLLFFALFAVAWLLAGCASDPEPWPPEKPARPAPAGVIKSLGAALWFLKVLP